MLFIHPYYKLEWFQIHWGGHQEQQEEIVNGNPDTKNWVDEATRVVERIVRPIFLSFSIIPDRLPDG